MIDQLNIFGGFEFSPQTRIWATLAPGIFVLAYFLVSFLVYTIRYFIKGSYQDHEIPQRGGSAILNVWIRLYFIWLISPILRLVLRLGIPANAITTLSIFVAASAGFSIATGHFALGGWLYILSGVLDIFDGRVARATGQENKVGSALDSILDRYSDSVIMIGLAWYYRQSFVLILIMLALTGSLIIPYIRAKGEALGMTMKVGLMQRPERILYLGVPVALSPIVEALLAPMDPHPIYRLAVAGIVLLTISTQLTAVQRFFFLIRELQGTQKPLIRFGEGDFWRNSIASFLATIADFVVFLVLLQSLALRPWWATALAALAGGLLHFSINRLWMLGHVAPFVPQMKRYAVVSLSSAFLNAVGVAILLMLPTMDYRLAWIVVRIAVFFSWNFPLQRNYVFSDVFQQQAPQQKKSSSI